MVFRDSKLLTDFANMLEKSAYNFSMFEMATVKDSDLLEMTSLKKLPSETRTEALLVKYLAYFGICQ